MELCSKVEFRVGEGNKVCFGVNDWLGVVPMRRVYQRLYQLTLNKLSFVKYCYKEEGGFVSWAVSLRRTLRQSKEPLCDSLSSLLSNVFLCRFEVDTRISFGAFPSRSFYRSLEETQGGSAPSSHFWRSLAVLRVEIFLSTGNFGQGVDGEQS